MFLNVVTGEEESCLLPRQNAEPFSENYQPSSTKATDFAFILARRLYYSRLTTFVYGFVLAVNVFVLLRGLIFREIDVYLVAAECFVTFMLVLEVVLRIIMQGRSFFAEWSNLFDFSVMITCVILLFASNDLWADIDSPQQFKYSMEDAEDVVEQLLTAVRFGMQIVRTVTLALHQKRSHLSQECVDFSALRTM